MEAKTEFVGRQSERERMRGALDEARAGRPTVWLLTGEAGIGKTRLARELEAEAEAGGFQTAWGAAWEGRGAPAYWPWRQIMADLEAAGAVLEPDLAELLPRTTAPRAAHKQSDAVDVEDARFRINDGLHRLLEKSAAARPTFLVLDDLHVADLPSIQALEFCARHLRRARVILLVTIRTALRSTSVDPPRADVDAALARVAREATTLIVPPLAEVDAAVVLDRLAGALSPAVAGEVLSTTGGNPLYLCEVARLLAAVPANRGEALPLPPSVREAVRQRLATLSDRTTAVVEAVAVLGEGADLAELERILGRPVSEDLTLALSASVFTAPRTGTVAFAHPLMREVIYRGLATAERERLHEAVARALESTLSGAARVAHHWLSAPRANARHAVVWAIRGAEQLLASGAHEEALLLLERATSHLPWLSEVDLRLRGELLLATALAEMQSGNPKRAYASAMEASSLAKQGGDAVLEARSVLVYANELDAGRVDSDLVGKLAEALETLGDREPSLRVQLEARLAAARQPSGNPREHMALASRAIEEARGFDEATELTVIHYGMAALIDFADARERISLNERAEVLAIRFGDLPKAMRAHARLVIDAMELGDPSMADAHLEAYLEMARRLRSPRHAWPGAMLRAMRALFEGRFADAESFVDEALTIGRAADDRWVSPSLVAHRLVRARTMEQHADVVAGTYRFVRLVSHFEDGETLSNVTIAAAYTRVEREEEARAAWSKIEKLPALATIDRPVMSLAAETAAFLGDRERCRELLEHVVPREHDWTSWGLFAFACEGPVARLAGLLHAALGNREAAERSFSAALDACARLGSTPHALRIRYERSRAFGGTDFEAIAREARAAGLDGLGDLAERRKKAAVPRPAPTPNAEPLSIEREGEVFTVTWRDSVVRVKDSRGVRILEQLVRSPGVEVHALDLADAPGDGVIDLGDVGETLDGRAARDYRAEILRLRDTVEQATALGNGDAAARAREQMDFLARELSAAVGLGGRWRRKSQNAERARVAVQRRIRDVLRKVAEQSKPLGAHLERTVRTGLFCVYEPERDR